MLNQQLWNLYKNSDEGKNAIKLFTVKEDSLYDDIQEISDYSENWGDIPLIYNSDFFYIFSKNILCYPNLANKVSNRENFLKFIEEYDIVDFEEDENGSITFHEEELIIPKERHREKNARIDMLAMVLFLEFPDKYKPLFLTNKFPQIQQNCDALGIELPPIPRTRDYKEYMMYYWDLCQVWNEYQLENNLSNAEFCACLYDFAPKLEMPKPSTELPKPTNVWLVGADKTDFKFLDNLGSTEDSKKHISIWQCNEKTKRGDIIVIYCRTPRSYIHSIWRANSSGFFNPFDFYQCRTTICNGVKISPITLKELNSDPYLSQMPIVRKNLQGVNGVELSAKDYFEMFRFLKDRGDDTDNLPKLFDVENIDFGEIKIEKDVEEKILIPILTQLGYKESDWTRQLSQKAGRGLKAIPDFVFFPKGEKHFESAPFVIEAKYDMSPMTERINAYSQCLSYARLLRSKLMAICDKERLVVFKVDDNGASDRNNPIFEDHWTNIYNDEIVGGKLNKIIGKEVVINL